MREQGVNHLVVKTENHGLAMFLTQIRFMDIYPELLKKVLLFADSFYNGEAQDTGKRKWKYESNVRYSKRF